MKEKILAFLKSVDEDYLEFISTLSSRKINPFNNSKERATFNEYWYPRKYVSSVTGNNINIFYNIQEVDFTKFSWNFMKKYTTDEELSSLMKIIDELNESVTDDDMQYRIKRLRIHTFYALAYVGSPFFNIACQKLCVEGMFDAMKRLNEYLNSRVKIISTTYDSVSFIGEIDFVALKKYLGLEFKVRTAMKMIQFRNVGMYKTPEGVWITKKITGTRYDDIKIQVLECLKDKEDFGKAILLVNKAELPMMMKKEYIRDVIAAREAANVTSRS